MPKDEHDVIDQIAAIIRDMSEANDTYAPWQQIVCNPVSFQNQSQFHP
ncbi:hypothetical protein I551_1007 [Mycobacterium ulcerans str. Harvey]|uniref:Uncharacterized protein n=1 Tax=Mycobacterium ulcerans str. Harvey TaxID=1299332 RepID=A0ABP3ARH4_MYCUL|nr:hypothetical protein I551_1007 [Mycobacterium ulcerans str. Harvey]